MLNESRKRSSANKCESYSALCPRPDLVPTPDSKQHAVAAGVGIRDRDRGSGLLFLAIPSDPDPDHSNDELCSVPLAKRPSFPQGVPVVFAYLSMHNK